MNTDELTTHMLATLTPEQQDEAVRGAVETLAGNMETLCAELREILASGAPFRYSPEIWISWLAEAEGKFGSAVGCAARSAGLVATA